MANNNYRTKKKSRFNVAGIIALIVAAAVTVTTLGVGTSGFKDWSFSRFFPKSEVQEQQPDDEQPDENEQADNTVITVSEEHGLKLMSATIAPENYAEYGVSTYAESAFSLTVTITPSNATYQAVDMTLKWKNPQSEWASGKSVSDYLTINQTSDGSLTATGTVLQAFSEPIEITATLRGQEEITAKAQVDYVGHYTGLYNYGHYDELNPVDAIGDGMFVTNIKLADGTIAPENEDTLTLRVYLENSVVEALEALGYDMVNVLEYTSSIDLESNECDFSSLETYYYAFAGLKYNSENADQYLSDLGEIMLNGQTAASKSGEYCNLQIEIFSNRKYNNNTYESIEIMSRSDICLSNWTDFIVFADGMSFDNSQIVVG